MTSVSLDSIGVNSENAHATGSERSQLKKTKRDQQTEVGGRFILRVIVVHQQVSPSLAFRT